MQFLAFWIFHCLFHIVSHVQGISCFFKQTSDKNILFFCILKQQIDSSPLALQKMFTWYLIGCNGIFYVKKLIYTSKNIFFRKPNSYSIFLFYLQFKLLNCHPCFLSVNTTDIPPPPTFRKKKLIQGTFSVVTISFFFYKYINIYYFKNKFSKINFVFVFMFSKLHLRLLNIPLPQMPTNERYISGRNDAFGVQKY